MANASSENKQASERVTRAKGKEQGARGEEYRAGGMAGVAHHDKAL